MLVMAETLGDVLRRAREAKQPKLSQGKLGKEFGIKRESVSSWESGKTAPTPDKIPRLATVLGLDPNYLLTLYEAGAGREPTSSARQPPPPAPSFLPRETLVGGNDLPVFAAAMGGSGHLIVTFDPVEYVRRPEPLARVKNGYGILVTGDSMIPAFRPGDIALVHPNLALLRDSDVVLYRVPPDESAEAIIKHLVSWDDRRWRLEQFSPPRQFQENRAEWQVCHRIVGRYDRR